MTAKRVLYEGHVQGVGFRYSTKRLAMGFDVVGWVRNLPDGRVELLVGGEPGEVDAFLDELEHDSPLRSHIQKASREDAAPDPDLRGFDIRH